MRHLGKTLALSRCKGQLSSEGFGSKYKLWVLNPLQGVLPAKRMVNQH